MLFIDLETYKIGRRLTPRIVSITYDQGLFNGVQHPGPFSDTITRDHFESFKGLMIERLYDGVVGHNVAYDLACLCNEWPDLIPHVFEAYKAGRVVDTMITEKLKAIEDGDIDRRRFTLAHLARKYLAVEMEGKNDPDAWRLRYSELDGVSFDNWPKEAQDYATLDVRYLWLIWEAQGAHKRDTSGQPAAAFALHLISIYGMRINRARADVWLENVAEEARKGAAMAQKLGILRANGTRNVKLLREIVAEAYNGAPPFTDKGAVKTDGETLKGSKNPALVEYQKSRFADKLATTYAPILRDGQTVHPRYNVLVKSGRTSCSKPNMQNPPRGGGFREVFEPRPGFVYVLCDYDQIELVALGQIHLWMFKTSAIADAVNEGRDLHLEVAAKLNPDNPKAYRQAAKICNYGYPGGLSSRVFIEYAKGFGLDFDEDESREMRKAWLDTWPEMAKYFDHIGRATAWGPTEVRQFKSGRIRGACSFTQYANTLFQGLTADGAKAALFKVSRACYTDEKSPLYGSRPVAFLHDEIILESPEDKAAGAAAELQKQMIEAMGEFIPDVKVTAGAYLSRVWSKNAGEVYGPGGELVPWEP